MAYMTWAACTAWVRSSTRDNEPVFHERWEATAYALNRAMAAWGKWNIDAARYQIELIPPADYLRMSYYEKWFTRLVELVVQSGLVTRAEVDSGQPAPDSPKATPALVTEMVPGTLSSGIASSQDASVTPLQGRRARARTQHPSERAHAPAALCARQGGRNRS